MRRQLFTYFGLTFLISWAGAAAVVAPKLLAGHPIGKFDGLMMFPVMLLGPALAGLGCALAFRGWGGLRALGGRMVRLPRSPAWALVLALPPALVFAVLSGLAAFVSPRFAPNSFFVGIGFGVVAGFFEEIGWTGFATEAFVRERARLGYAVLLGLLWGAWHLPVIDYLGAATPHGAWWPAFAAAFIAAMAAMRLIIVWVYANTGSVLMAQLTHAASTASLVVLSPQVAPGQEALWYGVYALALWVVALALNGFGRRARDAAPPQAGTAGA